MFVLQSVKKQIENFGERRQTDHQLEGQSVRQTSIWSISGIEKD